ncbi:FAS1 domain-containing protein [Pleomassaria siparia CBS 279.74]|uniref:FAS1 domain-containing protein n=1 Tax=Pleomassaria siparia CBS 279.74 TaxID=1314801 RepID=A0A6G1KI66_9PLEO|nr:FAS1 domain-containing protein [Pleomassaria siparia CBS 279.74]
MQFKILSLLGLAAHAAAQTSNNTLNSTLSSRPELSNLTSLLNTNSALVAALENASNVTILAPSNEAFAALDMSSLTDSSLVDALLQYHVLNGTYTAAQITDMSTFVPTLLNNKSYSNITGGQVVECIKVGDETVFYSGLLQNSTVTTADVNFTGGVMHIVDRVLTLPVDVLDTASAAGLSSFHGAVNATDLSNVANYTPDLTIFAPNNEAFRSVYDALQNLSSNDLTNIISYHVVNGSSPHYSSTLQSGTMLQTILGQNLAITIENGTVFVNAARVITPNVLVANGVVHIIDNVLNPSNTEVANSTQASGAPAYTATASASEDPFTSGQSAPSTTIGSIPTSGSAGPTSSSRSTAGAHMPMKTGTISYGALLGAGAAVLGGLI